MKRKPDLMHRIGKTVLRYCVCYAPIVLLLVCCFIIRSQYDVIIYYDTDTVGYFYASRRILDGIIDPLRPPVYPFVLKMFTLLWSRDPFPAIAVFQGICSFLSIVPFYLVCSRWISNRQLVLLASLIYACFPLLQTYNGAIFPESLLVVCYVLLLFLFSIYIQKPKRERAWMLNIALVVMVLLKPGSLYLYAALAIIWLIRIGKAGSITAYRVEVGSYLVSLVLLLSYCQLNSYQNGFFGVSAVTHDNNFANVITSGAYKSIPNKKLVEAIDSNMKNGVYYTIYYLNNDHDFIQQQYKNFPYVNNSNMDYVSGIPSCNDGYTRGMLDRYIKGAMYTKGYCYYILDNIWTFAVSTVFFVKGYMILILMLLLAGFIVYAGLIKRNILYLDIFTLVASGGMVITFFIAGFGQTERILMPVVPLFIFQFFRVFDLLGQIIDTKKLAVLASVKQL